MPKMKTHKAAQKRFQITGSGKIMRTKGGKSHLRRRRSAQAKRLYYETIPVSPSDRLRVSRLLPYGIK
jgi:large subunit ribosomal protein L35